MLGLVVARVCALGRALAVAGRVGVRNGRAERGALAFEVRATLGRALRAGAVDGRALLGVCMTTARPLRGFADCVGADLRAW